MAAWDHRRVVELVDAALDLDPAARTDFLDRECADEPELRSEVESLLEEDYVSDGSFLANPAVLELVEEASSGTAFGEVESSPPNRVGPYRILEELGRGGMGTVYLAEQREPIERQVALKVFRGFGKRSSRRFAAECAALARLKHPNIAAVYDAGVAEDGVAFVTMEWVEGAHITDWCDGKRLSIRERIELFLSVCAGVRHAHQKGLVHRDLKPSNVLVVDVDGKATAKVIDFGIARSLDEAEASPRGDVSRALLGDDGGALGHSRSLLVGSPAYMSPEAMEPTEQLDLDTRSDVYSLGVLLYELLLGTLPFDLSNLALGSLMRQVRTADLPTLGERWSQLGVDDQEQLAALRGLSPKALTHKLGGDLEAVLRKTMARNRESRYGSVEELVADLNRYLQHRPVEARELSLPYRLSRFVRRNVGQVAVAAMVVGLLILGVVARTQEAQRANEEAEKARQAQAEAEQVSEFLIGLFEVVDPDRPAGEPESVDELLAKAEATMDEELADQPLVRARFAQTLGRVAMTRSDLDRAVPLYEQALALREEHQPPGHPEIITTVGSLGVLYRRQGRLDEAEKALERAVQMLEANPDSDPAQFAATLTWLANLHYHQKRSEEAVAGHRRALEIRRGEEPLNIGAMGESLNNLSVALRELGRYSEAKPILEEAQKYFSQSLGPEHPVTLVCLLNMAGIEEKLGRWQEAEDLLKQAADAWMEIYGPNHFRTLLARRAIGSLWIRWHREEEAIAHLRELLAEQEAILEGSAIEVEKTRVSLAVALLEKGNVDAAEPLFQQSLEAYSELLGDEHYSTTSVRHSLALVVWERGDAAEAIRQLEDLAAEREKQLGERHRGVALVQWNLGRVFLDQGRLDEAEGAFRRALSIHEAAQGDPSVYVGRDLLWLGRVLREQGRVDEAQQLTTRALAIFEKVLPEQHPDLLAARAEG